MNKDKINYYNIALFFRFLKKNKAYDLFRENLFYHDYAKKLDYTDKTQMFGNAIIGKQNIALAPKEFLRTAFHWASTNQGDKFWRTLNTQWSRSYCGEKMSICYLTNYEDYEVNVKIKRE